MEEIDETGNIIRSEQAPDIEDRRARWNSIDYLSERVEEIESELKRLNQRLNSQAEHLKELSPPANINLYSQLIEHEAREIQELHKRVENELHVLEQKLRRINVPLVTIEDSEIVIKRKMKEINEKLNEFQKKRFLLPFIGCIVAIQVLIILYLFLLL